MTASSQNHPGAQPRNLPYDPAPLQAAVASYAAVLPVPAGSPAPESPEASDVSPVHAASGVIRAAMEHGSSTALEIAQAEQDAGLLFDPQRAEDIAAAAYEQAKAEDRAELAERGEALAIMTDFKHRLDRIMRLVEGRPGDDAMLVREILTAAHGAHGTLDIPLTLVWDRRVDVPEQGAADQRAIVECTTAHGGRAHLVLNRDERLALASLLDAEIVRDVYAPCPTEGCGGTGSVDNVFDPKFAGWSRVYVAGIVGVQRWYCSPPCVSNALARAGAELAEADHRAELDGGL